MDEEISKDYWPRPKIAKLIELYKSQDCLWNVDNHAYRDKRIRIAAWKTIATSIGHDVIRVERKIKVLKTQFMHCYKIYKKYLMNGQQYQPKWFAYNSLKFLIPGKIYRENREISRMQQQGLQLIKTETLDVAPEEVFLVDDCEEQPSTTITPLRNTLSNHTTTTPTNFPIQTISNEDQPYWTQPEEESRNVSHVYRDEYTIFGELIACRLRKIRDPRKRLTLQYNMNNLLFDVEMQEIDKNFEPANGFSLNGSGNA